VGRVLRSLVVMALLAGAGVLIDAAPASAAVTITSGGTTVAINIVGDAYVQPLCEVGNVYIQIDGGSDTPASPAIACSAVTKFQVTGDSGNQTFYGQQLDNSAFSAHPYIQAVMNDGVDIMFDTLQSDAINLGPGDDVLNLDENTVANSVNNLGTGNFDKVQSDGTNLADTITAASGSSNASITFSNVNGTHTNIVNGVDGVHLLGNGGNDTLDTTAVIAASSISGLVLDGGTGANTLTSGQHGAVMYNAPAQLGGGPATMNGGTGNDTFYSEDPGDVIHGGGGLDIVYDQDTPHSGGRAFDTPADTATWDTALNTENDVVARIRPGAAAGSSTIVASLSRSGIQQLVPRVASLVIALDYGGHRDELGMLDAVLPSGGQMIFGYADQYNNDVADITIPSGTWTTSGTMATVFTINPTDSAYGDVNLEHFGPLSIHGPWTDMNAGFAHRVTRDLVFRFLTTAQRNDVVASLTSHAKTRLDVAHDLIFTDEYRGLDVDRIFRRFLKRQSDPGGRTYWINAMRGGRSLRKFRAQLFASNEYFTKAGSTNEGFVNAAYADVLGRAPDAAGRAYWIHKLDTGTSRSTVANTYLGSTEARRTIIKEQFLRFLDRYPTTSEIDAWMEPLRVSATGEQDLIGFLSASNAYFTRT
jgi:hypothetical protein